MLRWLCVAIFAMLLGVGPLFADPPAGMPTVLSGDITWTNDLGLNWLSNGPSRVLEWTDSLGGGLGVPGYFWRGQLEDEGINGQAGVAIYQNFGSWRVERIHTPHTSGASNDWDYGTLRDANGGGSDSAHSPLVYDPEDGFSYAGAGLTFSPAYGAVVPEPVGAGGLFTFFLAASCRRRGRRQNSGFSPA